MTTTLPQNAILQVSSAGSGSTLLANLLNIHPQLVLVNEVFAKPRYLLPIWDLWKHNPVQYEAQLKEELMALYALTYPFGIKYTRQIRCARFAQALSVKTLNRLEASLRKDRFKSKVYKSFYINSFHQPLWKPLWETIRPKQAETTILFKDINIVNSLKAFDHLYPNGKIIFLIRHPLDFLHSTLKKAKQHGDKAGFGINEKSLFDLYGNHFLELQHLYNDHAEAKILIAWRLSNELMLRKMHEWPADKVLSLTYSRMVLNLEEVIREVHQFINLEPAPTCLNLIDQLKNDQYKQKHSRSIFRPLKLNKLSEQVPFETLKRWNAYVNDSELMEYFKFEKYI